MKIHNEKPVFTHILTGLLIITVITIIGTLATSVIYTNKMWGKQESMGLSPIWNIKYATKPEETRINSIIMEEDVPFKWVKVEGYNLPLKFTFEYETTHKRYGVETKKEYTTKDYSFISDALGEIGKKFLYFNEQANSLLHSVKDAKSPLSEYLIIKTNDLSVEFLEFYESIKKSKPNENIIVTDREITTTKTESPYKRLDQFYDPKRMSEMLDDAKRIDELSKKWKLPKDWKPPKYKADVDKFGHIQILEDEESTQDEESTIEVEDQKPKAIEVLKTIIERTEKNTYTGYLLKLADKEKKGMAEKGFRTSGWILDTRINDAKMEFCPPTYKLFWAIIIEVMIGIAAFTLLILVNSRLGLK